MARLDAQIIKPGVGSEICGGHGIPREHILAGGGYNGQTYLSSAESYDDIEMNRWEPCAWW